MPSTELSTTIILSEIVIIETVIIISLLVYFFLKSKKKSLKLDSLLKSFQDDEKNRLTSLSSTFQKTDFIDDEKYNTALKEVISKENSFYKYLTTAFYHNDLKRLDTLSSEIQEITKSCAIFVSENKQEITDKDIDKSPETDVDAVIDELLSDDNDIEEEIKNDPAFDLSESTESDSETQSEELIEKNIENNEIAEIPNDLLNNNNLTAADEEKTEVIPEDNQSENKLDK